MTAIGTAFAALTATQIVAFAAIWVGIAALLYFTGALGSTINLTHVKQRVTIQFQAHPNATAGGLFGLLVLKANP